MKGSFKLLPMLIIVAFLSFSVRLTEVVTGLSNISSTAFAESKKEDEGQKKDQKEAKNKKESKGEDKGNKTVKDDKQDEGVEVVKDKKKAEAPKWRDANDADLGMAGVKMEIFEDLSKRRQILEKREKDLHMRQALLKAAEQELERKYQELNNLRNEIEGLLKQQSDAEEARIGSLVKIYEGMKPKDAARIFDTLDLDVLISVVGKMSERKVSPIMAAMNPERVRTITIMLAEQKKLPSLR